MRRSVIWEGFRVEPATPPRQKKLLEVVRVSDLAASCAPPRSGVSGIS